MKWKNIFGHQKRDFVFVDDVAEVYNNIILNITKLPTPYFEDLEIGLGKSIHLRDFIENKNEINSWLWSNRI